MNSIFFFFLHMESMNKTEVKALDTDNLVYSASLLTRLGS